LASLAIVLRLRLMRSLLLGLLLLGTPVLADDGGVGDAGLSLPDASVGMGGADHGSEENDPNGACTTDRDCDRGLACRNGTCVYRPYRDAVNEGCDATGLLAPLLAVLTLRRRRA
jgi:hypothetical protein